MATVDLTESEELLLPGSTARTLRHAESLTEPGEEP